MSVCDDQHASSAACFPPIKAEPTTEIWRHREKQNGEKPYRGFTRKNADQGGMDSGVVLAKSQWPITKSRFCYLPFANCRVCLRGGKGVCNFNCSHGLPASNRWTAVRARSVFMHRALPVEVWPSTFGRWCYFV